MQYNIEYFKGPANPAFIDATLSYQDIAYGLHLEYNPNGILWRVNAAGVPTYKDLNNYYEQQRVIEDATNRTMEEFQPLLNASKGSTTWEEEAKYAIKNGKLYASAGMFDMNPYAVGDGESKVGAANRSKIGPDGEDNYKGVGVQELVKANGQWTLVFSSEGNYGDVTLYDENKNVIMSFPATSGRIGVTDRTLENKGPIPLGSYTLDPKKISGGLEKAIQRNILLMQDWGFYRVKLNPQGVNTSRGEFFLHGGFFPGSAGCIDIGTKDLELFRLLMQHEGLIKLEVIEGKPNDILFPNGQRYA